jgi:DNA polymerase-3 subunit epsilon
VFFVRRTVYPAISRLAHRVLSERNEPVKLEELARTIGFEGVARALPGLLDGRFKRDDLSLSLWAWERDFPALGETIVVIDLEATGGHLTRDELIDIGAVKLGPGGYEEFGALNDPKRPIPPFITKLTGISHAMVKNAPPLEASLEKLAQFIEGATVVIQDAHFDVAFLEPRFARLGFKLNNPLVDTLNLAKKTLPGRRRRGLDSLAATYGVTIESRHRALGDARATLHVTREMYHALTAGNPLRLSTLHDQIKPTQHGERAASTHDQIKRPKHDQSRAQHDSAPRVQHDPASRVQHDQTPRARGPRAEQRHQPMQPPDPTDDPRLERGSTSTPPPPERPV